MIESEITIVIPGQPCPMNRYWGQGRGGRIYVTERGRDFRSRVAMAVLGLDIDDLSGATVVPGTASRVTAHVEARVRRRRKDTGKPYIDCDAALKPTLDALTHARVWEDDRMCDAATSTRSYDPKMESTIVKVRWWG